MFYHCQILCTLSFKLIKTQLHSDQMQGYNPRPNYVGNMALPNGIIATEKQSAYQVMYVYT